MHHKTDGQILYQYHDKNHIRRLIYGQQYKGSVRRQGKLCF